MNRQHKPVSSGVQFGLSRCSAPSVLAAVALFATSSAFAATQEIADTAKHDRANFAAIHDFIATNKRGESVVLRVGSNSEPLVFSLRNRLLEPMRPGFKVEKAVVYASGIEILNWRDGQASLKGRCRDLDRESSTAGNTMCELPLGLEKNDVSLSLAFANSGDWFVLGARDSMRVFDRRGKQKWSTSLPPTQGVVVSGDNRTIISAHDDGVVRWHRAQDGSPLLSLFVHSDGKRWVAWTPQGYYDSSAGGEDLIGWRIVQGSKDMQGFYPASRFRAERYRPQLVRNALRVSSAAPQEHVAQTPPPVEQDLPPSVRIVSPTNDATFDQTELTLLVRAVAPDGSKIDCLRVLLDGVVASVINCGEASAARGITISAAPANSDATHQLRLSVPPRDVELAVIAQLGKATSVAAKTQLRWAGKTLDDVPTLDTKPALYVLAIGVSDYTDSKLKLNYAATDAQDFSTLLNKQSNFQLYRDVTVKTLVNEEAKRDNVLEALEWIEKQATDTDVSIVFLAGHGVNDDQGDYYYLPADVDIKRLRSSALPYTEIQRTIKRLAGKKLFFVDTCHAGNSSGGRDSLLDVNGVSNELASAESGVVVYASSTGRQYSLEHNDWQNGAFTEALLEGLQGKADYTSAGQITVNELDLYISNRVKELTKGRQTPTTRKPDMIPDFPLVLVVSKGAASL